MFDHEPINGSATQIRALHDTVERSLSTLKSLEVNTQTWDPILGFLIRRKLDHNTLAALEDAADALTEVPTLSSVLNFLERRSCMLETLSEQPGAKTKPTVAARSTHIVCRVCNQTQHTIASCNMFRNMTPDERRNIIYRLRGCSNCLSTNHKFGSCPSIRTCRHCGQRHHSMLHNVNHGLVSGPQTTAVATIIPSDTTDNSRPPSVKVAVNSCQEATTKYVLLGTAKVQLTGPNNFHEQCRTLIDPGSQISLMSRRMANRLALPVTKTAVTIGGIGGKTQESTSRAMVKMSSLTSNFKTDIEVIILPQLMTDQPSEPVTETLNIPRNIHLDDPWFKEPGAIDLVLGADIYPQLTRKENILLGRNKPLLQDTNLGWIVLGPTIQQASFSAAVNVTIDQKETLTSELERFWKMDTLPYDFPL
ncbi:uncharacterized protein [Drosophila takahashii]|uniref:uncharacterized protein n=1 Tax=Drosophila takahashii TaxID=29030 RepID=UPI0038991307